VTGPAGPAPLSRLELPGRQFTTLPACGRLRPAPDRGEIPPPRTEPRRPRTLRLCTASIPVGCSPRSRISSPIIPQVAHCPIRVWGAPALVRTGPHRGRLVATTAVPTRAAPRKAGHAGPPGGGRAPGERTRARRCFHPPSHGGRASTPGRPPTLVACSRFRYFELSLQSALHRSITLLVRYRSQPGICALRGVDLAVQAAVPRSSTRW